MNMKEAMKAGVDIGEIYVKVNSYNDLVNQIEEVDKKLTSLKLGADILNSELTALLDNVPEDESGEKTLDLKHFTVVLDVDGYIQIEGAE